MKGEDQMIDPNNIPSPFPKPKPQVQPSAQTAQATATPQQPSGSPAQTASQNTQQQHFVFNCIQSYDYFQSGTFSKDIAHYQSFANRKTGYSNLDMIQPLYPGLYCLGAISSLGKTTFVHQMADQLAAAGDVVMYFSLEQNRFELFSKSIARRFFLTNRQRTLQTKSKSDYPTPSSIDLRRGNGSAFSAELQQEIDNYKNLVGNNLMILEGSFSVTVEDIVVATEEVIKQLNGRKPVVIVDYLQIIAPSLIGGRVPDTKTSIDHIVHTLKTLQSMHNLTVIAISSVNRSNYMTPVDFESFKESGGIEYTADIVWGLQLGVLHDPDFEKEKSIVKQREMIVEAKAATPRAIELVCLKNRYGVSSYNAQFDYYASSDCFVPADPHIPFRPTF